MLSKPKLKGLALFVAGFLAAVVVMYGVFVNQGAQAGQYSCIRTDLNAQGMSGNIGDEQFTITYDVPGCYASNGYKATEAWMRGSQVAVRYKKQ